MVESVSLCCCVWHAVVGNEVEACNLRAGECQDFSSNATVQTFFDLTHPNTPIAEAKLPKMAVSTGKRKRSHEDDDGSTAGYEDDSAMKARFQKAFEAKFQPLPHTESQIEPEEQDGMDDETENESDSDEWDGLSDDGEIIEVINHDQSQSNSEIDQARERRIFMVRQSSKQSH